MPARFGNILCWQASCTCLNTSACLQNSDVPVTDVSTNNSRLIFIFRYQHTQSVHPNTSPPSHPHIMLFTMGLSTQPASHSFVRQKAEIKKKAIHTCSHYFIFGTKNSIPAVPLLNHVVPPIPDPAASTQSTGEPTPVPPPSTP